MYTSSVVSKKGLRALAQLAPLFQVHASFILTVFSSSYQEYKLLLLFALFGVFGILTPCMILCISTKRQYAMFRLDTTLYSVFAFVVYLSPPSYSLCLAGAVATHANLIQFLIRTAFSVAHYLGINLLTINKRHSK